MTADRVGSGSTNKDLLIEHNRQHLTDGFWHDGCRYCIERRSGVGAVPADEPTEAATLPLGIDEAMAWLAKAGPYEAALHLALMRQRARERDDLSRQIEHEHLDLAKARARLDAITERVAELHSQVNEHAIKYGAEDQRFRDGVMHSWSALQYVLRADR